MISAFDGFMERHPSIAGYTKERIRNLFRTSPIENILCCFLSSFALGCFIYMSANGIFCYVVSVITLIVWINALAASGFRKQWAMLFFVFAYFLLPFGVTELTGGTSGALGNICGLTSVPVIKIISDITGLTNEFSAVAALIVCVVFFALGTYTRSAAKTSDFYCKTRIDQMS